MSDKKLSILSRIIFSISGLVFILVLAYKNIEPFGITLHFSSTDLKNNISKLSPANRIEKSVKNGKEITKQIDDLIYFSANHPNRIETGKVKIKFKNPYPDQEIYIGFQNQDIWHYEKKLIDAPLLNGLNWNQIGENPILMQKQNIYNNFSDFINNPPKDSVIGFYRYDKDQLLKNSKIENYSPKNETTEFPIPLRGKHTFYVYVENEIFKMNIFLQDLNIDEGPDVTTIRIYKENSIVLERIIDDDGIENNSGKVLPPREEIIQNPGPELPEPGVYKVVIDAPSDTIIKKITTNLHKIVLEGPVFLAGNKDVYSKVIEETIPSNLYSNAKSISIKTLHNEGIQTIKVGDESIKIESLKTDYTFQPKTFRFNIESPQNDIILNGQLGYFSQNEAEFFEPSFYALMPITEKSDIDLADFILTDYLPSKKEGDWQIAETEFDLTNSRPKKGRLSWIILAPGLKEYGRNIEIGDIEVELYKKPLIKWK